MNALNYVAIGIGIGIVLLCTAAAIKCDRRQIVALIAVLVCITVGNCR